jgi:hypothetical protein
MPETAKAGRWNHGSSMAKSLRNRRFPNPRGGRWDMGPLAYMRGDLTPRAVALVIEWAMLHLGELSVCWQLAREMKPIPQIAPLE